MKVKKCPLCETNDTVFYNKDKKREYYKCNFCNTIFVPEEFHLSKQSQKKRYNLHTNSKTDQHYINFLKRIVEPVSKHAKQNWHGLDFGCGPDPILKNLFSVYNIIVDEYDIFYKNDAELLTQQWDFIITTEVVEHLSNPNEIIMGLWDLIKPNGVLGIMSNLYTDDIDFNSWYYKGDPTHICFFRKESFIWLATKLNAELEFFDKDITIFKKK